MKSQAVIPKCIIKNATVKYVYRVDWGLTNYIMLCSSLADVDKTLNKTNGYAIRVEKKYN